MNQNTYQGILFASDALASSSRVARNCTKGVDELSTQIFKYINSFEGFADWMANIESNVAGNFAKLAILSSQLVGEWQASNTNYTKVGGLIGEMAFYTLTFNTTSTLGYTRADPLAPAPMNIYVWTAFESFYEFMTQSQMSNETTLNDCQGSLLNMLLFHFDAYNNIMSNSIQEGIFLTLDSFTFLRPSIETCVFAGQEISTNFQTVFDRIKANPEVVRKNFEQQLFHVVSGSMATYAQIYHRDIISLHRVFGALVYRTLVRDPQ